MTPAPWYKVLNPPYLPQPTGQPVNDNNNANDIAEFLDIIPVIAFAAPFWEIKS